MDSDAVSHAHRDVLTVFQREKPLHCQTCGRFPVQTILSLRDRHAIAQIEAPLQFMVVIPSNQISSTGFLLRNVSLSALD
jgi:hypothetical protein